MSARPTRRRGRPSPPPPGLLFATGETLPGAEILSELREPAGVALWQAAHDVDLWSRAAPDGRGRIFATGALERRLGALERAAPHPEVEPLLARLAALLLGDPASAAPKEVAAACLGVAAWAGRRGATATALTFAQAAAMATPEEAHPALEAGLLALALSLTPERKEKARGDEARAESWLRRALVLARRERSNLAYARANVALGGIYARREQPLVARRFYLFALRRARRSGLREEKAAGLHGLFDLARGGGIPEDAETQARGAMRVYGAAHPRAPELWRGWVRWRLARDPEAEIVGPGDERLPFHGPAAARARLLAVLAREAAEAGAAEQFQRAWSRAWDLLGRNARRETERGRAETFLELGWAAMAAERPELAEHAGQRALEAALARGNGGDRGAAERFLEELWRRAGGMRWIGRPHGPAGAAERPGADEAVRGPGRRPAEADRLSASGLAVDTLYTSRSRSGTER